MNLSQLMLNFYRNNGKIKKHDEFVVTGGSATTIIDLKIATRKNPYDDDYGLGYTAFVVRDAGALSAAPENEFSAVSAYDSATQTFTIGTITAVAVGDKVALANDDIPVQTLMELANMMLKDLGRIELVDATLTTAANQTEYTLPLTAKYSLRRVEVQGQTTDSNDNRYRTVYTKDVTPAAPGSTGLLTLPQFATGYTIKLWYEGVHPTLTTYSSTISETIDDNLAIWGLSAYALQWYNSTLGGRNEFWQGREARAWQMFKAMLIERPIKKSKMTPNYFVLGRGKNKVKPAPVAAQE